MTVDFFWSHALVLTVVVASAYFMHMKTVRMRARFNMYRVRDRLVLLVADGTLQETSHVFTHFYKQVSFFLANDRPLGIDDLLPMVFRDIKNGDFERALREARSQADKMANDPDAKNEAVRAVIADFYNGFGMMLITHSSVLRVAYKLSHFFLGAALERAFSFIVPKRIGRGLAAINYAEHEANEFATQ